MSEEEEELTDEEKQEMAAAEAEAAMAAAMPAPGAPLLAARISDNHVCPMVTGLVPHVGGPIVLGCFTVLIVGAPAARIGDMAVCVGPPSSILMGSPTVLIGGAPAAKLTSTTAHGGTVVGPGAPTVMVP